MCHGVGVLKKNQQQPSCILPQGAPPQGLHSTAPECKIGAPVGSGRTGLCVSLFPAFSPQTLPGQPRGIEGRGCSGCPAPHRFAVPVCGQLAHFPPHLWRRRTKSPLSAAARFLAACSPAPSPPQLRVHHETLPSPPPCWRGAPLPKATRSESLRLPPLAPSKKGLSLRSAVPGEAAASLIFEA